MIKLKELESRKYSGNECVVFDYTMRDPYEKDNGDGTECFTARFARSKNDKKCWRMQVVLPRDRDCDCQVYQFSYMLPREGMDLALIAAIGLKYFQLKLKEEVQQKSNWDFIMGNLLNDM